MREKWGQNWGETKAGKDKETLWSIQFSMFGKVSSRCNVKRIPLGSVTLVLFKQPTFARHLRLLKGCIQTKLSMRCTQVFLFTFNKICLFWLRATATPQTEKQPPVAKRCVNIVQQQQQQPVVWKQHLPEILQIHRHTELDLFLMTLPPCHNLSLVHWIWSECNLTISKNHFINIPLRPLFTVQLVIYTLVEC